MSRLGRSSSHNRSDVANGLALAHDGTGRKDKETEYDGERTEGP